jgi:stage II sporulation protein D
MLTGVNIQNTFAVTNQMVKVGLFYRSNAQSQIDISSDKGVIFNAFDQAENKYFPVYQAGSDEAITVRKDSYFISAGLKYTPVAQTANPNSGPYHIQIQSNYNTYNDTLPVIQEYLQKGVPAYPVYTDMNWNIWTGFYVDKASAEAAVAAIRGKLGEKSYTVIEKADTRIYGVNSTGEVKFMYASVKNLLRGKSISTENTNLIKIGTAKLNLYRGEVEFLRKTGSDMTIINVLPLEEYLYGVVPNEIGGSSPEEALKAQAVAARTFAYSSINKHAAEGFNLCASTDCQAYKGYSSESPLCCKAIDETMDMVVTYNGKLAETVYFSSSGGKTESAVNVWGSSVPYLQSVVDEYEAGKSYNYNWNIKLTADEISQKLKSYNLGTVTGIEITKYSDAGRPVELIVKGTLKPEGVVFTKDKCRTFLGLPSQWYTLATNSDLNLNININNQNVKTQLSQVKIKNANGQIISINPASKVNIVGADGKTTTVAAANPTEFYFTGKGWGHAVGMSQEGAMGYARHGYTYNQILSHYYPGTIIELKK